MENAPKSTMYPIDLNLPVNLVVGVEEYRRKNDIEDFSDAIYELIRKGLEQ